MIPFKIYHQFNLGFITIYTGGFFLSLAFLIGFLVAYREVKRRGINLDFLTNLGLLILVGGLLGGRLGYLLQSPQNFLADPLGIFKFYLGGLSIYGGILTVWLAVWLYLRRLKIDFWPIADLLAPALALGIAIGRLGCILLNDHQGVITKLPWAIAWPDGSLRHPISLYLALAAFLIFLILWYLKERLSRPGQLFLMLLIFYAGSIFLLDFLRVDPKYFGLSGNQWVSLILFLAAIGKFSRRKFMLIKS